MQFVWFKKDLRVQDHLPLLNAADQGVVLPLYIVEPSIIHAEDFDPVHWTFIRQSLVELREALAALGQPLVVRIGEVVPILDEFRRLHGVDHLWAHQETGNWTSYQRDLAVIQWANEEGIPFTEIPQGGVVRRLKTRDRWSAIWERRMQQPIADTPTHLTPIPEIDPGDIPTHADLGLMPDRRRAGLGQVGGESHAQNTLRTFLTERGHRYHWDVSSPTRAAISGSRLVLT
jgi:deoxyribodipyrimidine photo-lyase